MDDAASRRDDTLLTVCFSLRLAEQSTHVIARASLRSPKQSMRAAALSAASGLLRRSAPRNDAFIARSAFIARRAFIGRLRPFIARSAFILGGGVLLLPALAFAQDLTVCTGKGYTLTSAADAAGASPIDNSNTPSYSFAEGKAEAGTYAYVRKASNTECPGGVFSNTYTVVVEATGTNQPQGSCTFTQPCVVGTFANFNPADYTSSSYVTLTDERDSKNYTVVKIGSSWIMAQNLNYQTGLTHQTNSNLPSTNSGGQITALIGNFWCPGGVNGSSATYSTLASCDVWGALYSWETAMSFDGKGAWAENATYNTGAADAEGSKFNHGRSSSGSGTSGRGICPPNWHVPTDFEWGVILDGMESSSNSTVHQTASGSNTWYGTDAGSRGKSKCTCSANGCNNDTDVSWYNDSSTQGTDVYGFRVLPAGYRNSNGSNFYNRGGSAFFWSSSAYNSSDAWTWHFNYDHATVYRFYTHRSHGFSVRCIRDE